MHIKWCEQWICSLINGPKGQFGPMIKYQAIVNQQWVNKLYSLKSFPYHGVSCLLGSSGQPCRRGDNHKHGVKQPLSLTSHTHICFSHPPTSFSEILHSISLPFSIPPSLLVPDSSSTSLSDNVFHE